MRVLHNSRIGDFTRDGQVVIHLLRMIGPVSQAEPCSKRQVSKSTPCGSAEIGHDDRPARDGLTAAELNVRADGLTIAWSVR